MRVINASTKKNAEKVSRWILNRIRECKDLQKQTYGSPVFKEEVGTVHWDIVIHADGYPAVGERYSSMDLFVGATCTDLNLKSITFCIRGHVLVITEDCHFNNLTLTLSSSGAVLELYNLFCKRHAEYLVDYCKKEEAKLSKLRILSFV